MAEFSFNGFQNLVTEEKDVLAMFKQKPSKSGEIRQGMSPDELADIVSDRLIEVIKAQFAETERKFQAAEK